MISGRELSRDEIDLIWTIDRSEVIQNVYHYQDGMLVLKPAHFIVTGWPPGVAEESTPILLDCIDRDGWFFGFFDSDKLIGVVILENKFVGSKLEKLQLKFLHVSQAYLGQGLGRKLFMLARDKARKKGAKQLYVSATPSEGTIKFYQIMGCTLAQELDQELFGLEPDDIHLTCWV